MAVQVGLLQTTESPVCMSLGSTRVLNLTARTLVSARRVTRPVRLARLGSKCEQFVCMCGVGGSKQASCDL